MLVERDERYLLSDEGPPWLGSVGFDAATITTSSRGIVHPCVDRSERSDHFAGPLAVAMLNHFVADRWLTRIGDSRALAVVPKAQRFFDDLRVVARSQA